MVDLGLVVLQVGFRLPEPHGVALQKHRFISDGARVMLDESPEGERVGPVQPEVREAFAAGPLI